ncbi:hypothetical protein PIN31115_03035 [Pandoraea iniqua]|uniref:Uncharacterized protein n=1 Tax=Pandoraea iniqua TaxID=2508288 RepID=A0A5E4W5C6_9BURK|nr:hypothetical protein PIN31115_03035 [Pandoraea iniqua]
MTARCAKPRVPATVDATRQVGRNRRVWLTWRWLTRERVYQGARKMCSPTGANRCTQAQSALSAHVDAHYRAEYFTWKTSREAIVPLRHQGQSICNRHALDMQLLCNRHPHAKRAPKRAFAKTTCRANDSRGVRGGNRNCQRRRTPRCHTGITACRPPSPARRRAPAAVATGRYRPPVPCRDGHRPCRPPAGPQS